MSLQNENTKLRKKNVLIELDKSGGLVNIACKNAGIGRTTYYEWMKEDPVFKEKAQAIIHEKVDNVEGALYRDALEGNVTAQIFFLKNKRSADWKDRSYVENTVDFSKSAEKARMMAMLDDPDTDEAQGDGKSN